MLPEINTELRLPYIRFERKPIEDKRRTLEAGRSVSNDVDFVLIQQIGSMDVTCLKVDTWLEENKRLVQNKRLPREWADAYARKYQAFKEDQELPDNGSPIRGWSQISPATQENLVAAGIKTIEQLSELSIEEVGFSHTLAENLKRMATNWLQAAKDHGPLTQKVTKLELELKNAYKTIDSLEEKVRILEGQLSQNSVSRGTKDVDNALYMVRREQITASDILPTEDVSDSEASFTSDLKAMQAEYKARYGRNPHSRMSIETLKKKLE